MSNKPKTTIESLLPEVYRSEINQAMLGSVFDRHLTPDDTVRVAGYIGTGNPAARVQRQLKEPTPHRQAYQLEPIMHTKVGTQDQVLTQHGFLKQLELMGVDINRLPEWGNTTQFNWIPPINIDMLVNYADYYWKPIVPGEPPQYLTIEGRCNKATGKVTAYDTMLSQYGGIIPVYTVDVANNALVVQNRYSDLFITGFPFFTKNTTDVNLNGKGWHVYESSFEATTGLTTITLVESMAIRQSTAPTDITQIGRWWYNTDSGELKKWSGTTWVFASPVVAVDISLTELRASYQADADCACNGSYGWDVGQFDDNQVGSFELDPWNGPLLANISYPTEADWMAQLPAGPARTPVSGDLWYDLTSDALKQYDGAAWEEVDDNFVNTLNETKGWYAWDYSTNCDRQTLNDWSQYNQWVHKSSITNTEGIIRAQLPILEYGSTIEMNSWTKVDRSWMYRNSIDAPFTQSTSPTRFELEPIRKFSVTVGSEFTITLDDFYTRDLNMSQVFVPGFRFRVVDDAGSETYEVKSSITSGTQVDGVVTVVTIVGNTYTSALQGGGVNNARIEPLLTSNGDAWRGYHLHWMLDMSSISYVPCAPMQENFLLTDAIITPTWQLNDGITSTSWSRVHQEVTDLVGGVSVISLKDELKYTSQLQDGTSPPQNSFALPGTLRVYVNDIRQYSSYTEDLTTVSPVYTYVGNDIHTTSSFEYVTGITLDTPLNKYDVVRIEAAPASYTDMGWGCVPVRTTTNDNTPPVYMDLSTFIKTEQPKTQLNQYPLFNTYTVRGELVGATPLFKYSEDSTAEINPSLQRRIIRSVDGRDYLFEQTLVDEDNGEIYAFRNLYALKSLPSPLYWYDTFTERLNVWDNTAWGQQYINRSTGVAFAPVVAENPPTLTYGALDAGALWYKPSAQELRQFDGIVWGDTIPVIVAGADPLLETIWRHGLNNEQYIPSYVDEKRVPVAIGDGGGDWETLDQWYYNSEHHNYKTVKYTELTSHLKSIITSQPSIPGLSGSSAYTLTFNAYNYGIGGTIKEHNDSFDTLVSAVNVNNVTPVGLIEFAEDQYNTLLLTIRDILNRSSLELFSSFSADSLINQSSMISKSVLEDFSTNDFVTSVYGDTTAYDALMDVGVKNWIVTPPLLGLAPAVAPHMITDGALVELFHHDGHRSYVMYTPAEEDKFARQLIKTPDNRVADGTLGIADSIIPPQTHPEFVDVFGGLAPRTGVYWYTVGSGMHQLYRFMPYAVTAFPPNISSTSTVQLPDGIRYYNSSDLTVYEKSGEVWLPITTPGSGDLTPLWVETSLQLALAGVYYEIEKELYAKASGVHSIFDYSMLHSTPEDEDVYQQYLRGRYDAYVNKHHIDSPTANTNYSASNAFSWNYVNSIVYGVPRIGISSEPRASWQSLYELWFGTPYPHLEPWCLQGYVNKPDWWDGEYLNTDGTRKWNYIHSTETGMWHNILVGIVPAGVKLPSGVISTGVSGEVVVYSYLPVNISDSVILGKYAPDALLPPYTDTNSIAGSLPMVRSLYTDYASQISGPDADYAYGDIGPIEWEWRISTEYVYDQLIVAFLMQPVRFMHYAFGTDRLVLGELQIDGTTNRVYSHELVLFHGDSYDTDSVYVANGLNQWYVNFNRYGGFDTNTEFRETWANWIPRLGYQSAGIMDTVTLEVFSKYMDVGKQDYDVVLANTGVVSDVWVDSITASVLNIPPAIQQYNNQNLWKFSIDTAATINRDMEGYRVQHYPVSVDAGTNTFSAMTFALQRATSGSNRFYVSGNQQQVLLEGTSITISDTTANNGTYTIVSSVYETNSNSTRITVGSPVVTRGAEGKLVVSGFILPWQTGDMVFGFTTKMMPAPIYADVPYYVIKISNYSFKLATSPAEAAAGTFIDLVVPGSGDISFGKVASTFKVFGGAGNSKEIWYHFDIDRTNILRISPPTVVYGIQSVINIIDGFSTLASDRGVSFNEGSGGEVDPTTGRSVSWQLEIERFINFLFSLRNTRLAIEDSYSIAVADLVTNEMQFTDSPTKWTSGQAVVLSTTGTLPVPLFAGTAYYYIPTEDGKFTLSYTNTPTSDSIVNITTTGSGHLKVSRFRVNAAYPKFEINPVRNNVWINTPEGWLSDILVGPYQDIRSSQTVYDQYGRPITADKLLVYRRDEKSRIMIRSGLSNDVEPSIVELDDPYNYLHIGGCHLFTEGYEHVIMFNDYTVGGGLVYDSFVGLSTQKFDVDFRKSSSYSLRPTLGGFYLLEDNFYRNMEGMVTDIRNMYDTFTVPELHRETKYARALLGYTGDKEYYDLVNLNSKSQFLFYRGMIQAKGSTNSVKAYINSRRFVDAKIDEYWAWKIAEFGDYRRKVYPALKLVADDGALPDVRFEFVGSDDSVSNVDAAHNFIPIAFEDGYADRWEVMPETRSSVDNSALFLASTTSRVIRILCGSAPGLSTSEYDYHYMSGVEYVVVHGAKCDSIVTIRHVLATPYDDATHYSADIPNSTLVTMINSDVLKVDSVALAQPCILYIYCIEPAADINSPCTILDKKSDTVLSNAQYWDPARGYHSSKAIHNVDLHLTTDPAIYGTDLVTVSTHGGVWNGTEEGTRWLNTNVLEYTPYYDEAIQPDVNRRLAAWGTQADWSTISVYEWTASSIPPTRWDARAAVEESNTAIATEYRATGTVRQETYVRTRTPQPVISVTGSDIEITDGSVIQPGQYVKFTATTLPTPIQSSTSYYVASVTGDIITISEYYDSPVIVCTTPGVDVQLVPDFDMDGWSRAPLLRERVYAATLPGVGNITSVPTTLFDDGDVVDVYLNGLLIAASVVIDTNAVDLVNMVEVRVCDIIDVVRPEYLPTPEELGFNPDMDDDGTVHIQWTRYTPYTMLDVADSNGNMRVMYYFWTERGITRPTTRTSPLSLLETVQQLGTIPTPYYVVQKLVNDVVDPDNDTNPNTHPPVHITPMYYRQAILRGANAYITDNDRFVWRFTQDQTLRDDLDNGDTSLALKNKHAEWIMLRQEQPSAVPVYLWNKLTECIIGYKLTDSTVRVPALDRELYDDMYGTDTQYGLGDDQAFANGDMAWASVLAYLQDSNIDFSPTNIDDFFARNDLTTPAGIAAAMDEIYHTIGALHVNRMWFSTLMDAMTTKDKYRELFKTSWIALHGIRVLEVGGLFDD